MIVFSTKFPLKNEVTIQTCIDLFKKWIVNSPRYSLDISDLSEGNFEGYCKSKENETFSAIKFSDDSVKISAVQLKQTDEKGIWCVDCLITEENQVKYLLIQLDYTCDDYSVSKPKPHKPYVIKLFVSAKVCDMDWKFPVDDQLITVNSDNLDDCAAVMNGTSDNQLPVIYISRNYVKKTEINCKELAERLSGIAHVIVEDKLGIGGKLRQKTNDNNVYGGYIGVYYPHSTVCEKYNHIHYNSRHEMFNQIVNNVQNALVYRSEYSEYSWNQVLQLKLRQETKEKDEFFSYFDGEINNYRERIKELNDQLRKKQAIIDQLQERIDRQKQTNSAFYNKGNEPEFFDGEYSDLLRDLLSSALNNKGPDSRSYLLINSLLEQNPKISTAESALDKIQKCIAKNDRMTSILKNELKDLGFKITEEGKHYKLVFHDPRYTFSMAKSPGDFRDAQNFASDIMKKIDYRK